MFNSQCPYKIPMLARFSRWIRFDSFVSFHRTFKELWDRTPRRSISGTIVGVICDRLHSIVKSRDATEETTECLMCQQPRLHHRLVECFRDLTNKDLKNDLAGTLLNEVSMDYGMLPGAPHGPARALAFPAANDVQSRSICFSQEINCLLFSALYSGLSQVQY